MFKACTQCKLGCQPYKTKLSFSSARTPSFIVCLISMILNKELHGVYLKIYGNSSTLNKFSNTLKYVGQTTVVVLNNNKFLIPALAPVLLCCCYKLYRLSNQVAV